MAPHHRRRRRLRLNLTPQHLLAAALIVGLAALYAAYTAGPLEIRHQEDPGHQDPRAAPAETGLDTLTNAGWLRRNRRDVYEKLAALPWAADGLQGGQETGAAQKLLYAAVPEPALLENMLAEDWLSDGMSQEELEVTSYLTWIAQKDGPAAARLAAMPFLAHVDAGDLPALQGLHRQSRLGRLRLFLDHPSLAGGITGEQTALVAAAATGDEPSLIRRILTPGAATVETVQTASPRTPSLVISVIRTEQDADRHIIPSIQRAVEFAEDLMDQPLPVSQVIILLDREAAPPGYQGVNHGFAIAYQDTEQANGGVRSLELGLAHEIAHYYWHSNRNWLDEGLAGAMEHAYARANGIPHKPDNRGSRSCSLKTIRELEAGAPALRHPNYSCNYLLGERLFAGLKARTGEQEFRKRIRWLYQETLQLRAQRNPAGIVAVSRAFPEHLPELRRHWEGAESQP